MKELAKQLLLKIEADRDKIMCPLTSKEYGKLPDGFAESVINNRYPDYDIEIIDTEIECWDTPMGNYVGTLYIYFDLYPRGTLKKHI